MGVLARLPEGLHGILFVKFHFTFSLLENPESNGLQQGSKGSFRGSTALLLELEDKVAQAAASVQNTQSEVTKVKPLDRWTCWQERLKSAACVLRSPTSRTGLLL